MSYFAREVGNGKPACKQGPLESSVSNLKNLFLVGLASVIVSCTPEGRQFVNNMGYTAAGTFLQESIKSGMGAYDQGDVNVNVNTQGNYNSEERAVLNQVSKMPRVVCVGDVDNNGHPNWVYHDGNGGRYWAYEGFANERGIIGSKKEKGFFKRVFSYLSPQGNAELVPEDSLIIYYQK